METNKDERVNKKLLLAIISALLLIILVTVYFGLLSKRELMATTAQKNVLAANFKNLSDTLDVRNADIDKLKVQNLQLYSTISSSQKIIASEKEKLAAMLQNEKMTSKELDAANKTLVEYEASIVDLQKQIIDLNAKNQQLTSENQQLFTDLNTVKKTAAQLSEENKNLAGKVAFSALLQLVKVEIDGVKKRITGKEVIVHNIKAVESLRVSFQTGNNKSLSPGAVPLYVKIINPKGETIYLPNQGSGSIRLASNGTSTQFTKEADIDWNQANKKVIVYWTQDIQSAGIYKVEIYQSGYLIGKGEVKLN